MSQILAAAPHHSSFRSQELTHRKPRSGQFRIPEAAISGSWFVEAKEAEPKLPSGNER
jgi:hypothetical protein